MMMFVPDTQAAPVEKPFRIDPGLRQSFSPASSATRCTNEFRLGRVACVTPLMTESDPPEKRQAGTRRNAKMDFCNGVDIRTSSVFGIGLDFASVHL